MAIVLAALSAFMYGGGDFAGGYATRRSPAAAVLVFSQAAGALAVLPAFLLIGGGTPLPSGLLWGAGAGACGAAGLLALYSGIARTPVAVVSPVSALVGALIPMTFGLLAGELPSPPAWAGAALCLPAIVLLSSERGRPVDAPAVRKALLYGVTAGVGFGGFFILISRPPAEAGLWPLLTARGASVALMAAASLAAGRRVVPAAGDLGWAVLAGLLDMGANIAFILAVRSGMLILVSIVAATYPGPTVLLARWILGQRLGATRTAGLVLAIAGVALIGIG